MSLFSRIGAFSIPVSALLLFSASVHARTCEPRHFTLADAYEEADSIVVGIVTECERVGGTDRCAFATLEVLKDSTPTRDYAGFAESPGCGLGLYVGQQYLLFLNRDNEPLRYSEPLSIEGWAATQVNERLRILRDFRNGVTADVSGPWFFHKSFFGSCMLIHGVRGNQMEFTRRPEGAVPLEDLDWSQVTIDGRSAAFTPEQVRVFERMVEDNREVLQGNSQMLAVDFVESQSETPRDASIKVGNRSWPLQQREKKIYRVGEVIPAGFRYFARGADAEAILAALETPADVIVTATASAGKDAAPSPEPVLRFETRSTNLARVIGEYHACYGGEQK